MTSEGLSLAATVERLRLELEAQRREMRARSLIDQARGLLAERLSCDPDTAYEHLLHLAADTGVDPAVAAALLLSTSPPPPSHTPAQTATPNQPKNHPYTPNPDRPSQPTPAQPPNPPPDHATEPAPAQTPQPTPQPGDQPLNKAYATPPSQTPPRAPDQTYSIPDQTRELAGEQNPDRAYAPSPGQTQPRAPGQAYAPVPDQAREPSPKPAGEQGPGQAYAPSPGQTQPRAPGQAYAPVPDQAREPSPKPAGEQGPGQAHVPSPGQTEPLVPEQVDAADRARGAGGGRSLGQAYVPSAGQVPVREAGQGSGAGVAGRGAGLAWGNLGVDAAYVAGWGVEAGSGVEGLPAALGAARRLAAGALVEAGSADELARRLVDEALGWLGARGVVFALVEPDGALRLAGSYGLPPQVISEWSRIPPHVDVAVVQAAMRGVPLWDPDPREHVLIGLAAGVLGPRSCLPLRLGERVLGAAEIVWAEPPGADDPSRRFVTELLATCAHRLRQLPVAQGTEPWLRAVLEAAQHPAALLSPIRDVHGRVVDFHADAVNSDATDRPGTRSEDLVGRRLLESYPGLALTDLLEAYARVLETGVPLRRPPRQYASVSGGRVRPATMSVRACRVADRLLVSWQFHDDARELAAQLDQAQRLGNLGWSEWDLATGRAQWSDQLYPLFGRDPADGPAPLEALTGLVVPEDRPQAENLLHTLLRRREGADVELRLAGPPVRHVRVMAEPELDTAGEPVLVRAVCQDVTSRRRSERLLADSRRALEDSRRRIAEERHIAVELQHAILPLPRHPIRLPGLRVACRYLPAESETRVGGDWYEAAELPGGAVFLAIGDVSGHGLAAAAAMATLRNALSGLAVTGAAPDRLLGWLNQLVLHRQRSMTVSAAAGLFDPLTRSLTWAQAGHLPPVLVRKGTAELLDPPDGLLLGAVDEPVFGLAEVALAPGDLLLLYTDGLVERRRRDIDAGFGLLLEAATRAPADPQEALRHVLEAVGAPHADDDTCVVAVLVE